MWSRGADLLDVGALGLKVGGVVVVDLLERLCAVHKVAGVDADLLEALRDHHRDLRLEVDVRDDGRVVPVLRVRTTWVKRDGGQVVTTVSCDARQL